MSSRPRRTFGFAFVSGLALAFAFAACQQSVTPAAGPPPVLAPTEPTPECTDDAATSLYQRKIEPILTDDQPVTCNQCHLPGIDLSLFVRATPCQTMACLEQLGLVNLTQPESSTVLTWIGRAKPESTLITAEVIEQEHQAFLEWIQYSARCGSAVCPSYDDACDDPQTTGTSACSVAASVDAGVVNPGDCHELALEQLFTSNIYFWRERCYPCHFTSDTTVTIAPKWITDVAQTTSTPSVACATSSLETMHTVLSLGLVDLQTPEQSLLLLKPLDTPGGPVTHGGGQKFDGASDPSYASFLEWIRSYVTCAAQDSTLLRAAPPPSATAMTTTTATTDDAADSILAYCNCVLSNCHDQSHQKWGETDEELIAGCRAEALHVPSYGAPIAAGNFMECRTQFCKQSLDDSQFCNAALGEAICE